MIDLKVFTSKTKLEHSDYTFDDDTSLEKILTVITPKFEGEWVINLIDPSLKFALHLMERDIVPNYVKCNVYLKQAKLDIILMRYPKNEAKKQKPWDAYMIMVSELVHDINTDAAKYLYKAADGDVEMLKDALMLLDSKCEEQSITLQQVRNVYTQAKKPMYASEVVTSFFTKDRYRWQKYETLVRDLGESYAYNAIRKQVLNWLKDKGDYLENKDVKNRRISEVDSLFINYVYFLFINSVDHRDLPALMYEWDNRGRESVERRFYANIQ